MARYVPASVSATEGATFAVWAEPRERVVVVAEEPPPGFMLLGPRRLARSVAERKAAEAVRVAGFSLRETAQERMNAAQDRGETTRS